MKVRNSLLMLISLIILFPEFGMSQWVKVPSPASDTTFHMVRFISEDIGWVVGENYIYKTTDGGTSWINQDTLFVGYCKALYAIDSTTVVYSDFSGRGIRRTTDGGDTWYTADSSEYIYYDLKFVNDSLALQLRDQEELMIAQLYAKRQTAGKHGLLQLLFM
jgi:photosystem II stability/assembly factor-like uncharacterized protein